MDEIMSVEGDGRVRLFNVSDPQAPDGHTVYKVTLKVFTKSSGVSIEDTEVVVWRRFSQFQRLRKELIRLYHRTKGDIKDFPAFVKASYFDRFEEQVIEERRVACLQLLQFVGSQPVLYTSTTFKKFLEGGSVVDSKSSSSLTSMTSVESETSEDNIAVRRETTCSDMPDVPIEPLVADDMNSALPDPQSWPSVFDSPQAVRKSEDMVDNQDPANLVKHNLCWSESGDSLTVSRAPPDGQERKTLVVVDDLIDIQPPVNTESKADEENTSLMAVSDISGTGTDQHSGVEPYTFPPIDVDNIPTLTVRELGDVTWLGAQDSHDPSSGYSSPPGGVWLHKQPSDVSSLSSNDGQDQNESASMNVTELQRALSAEFEGSDLLSRNESERHNLMTPELDSEPTSHTSTVTSDSEADVSSDVLDTLKSAPRTDVGFEAEDSWWQQALSVCDQELAEGLLDVEMEGTSKAESNNKEDVVTDGLSDEKSGEVSFIESVADKSVAQPNGLQLEEPRDLTGKTSPGVAVASQNYISDASKTLSQAIACETQSDYQNAFDLYKAGVEMLLAGVQGETDKTRRQMVRKKIGQYLLRAELIFKQHIKTDGRVSPWESTQVGQLDRQSEAVLFQVTLADFKVLGLIDNVQLVQDKQTSEVFVLKALRKSYNPQVSRRKQRGRRLSKNRATTNTQCPYMVRLFHHFETQSCIFLLLEYVSGGKLINFINSTRNEIQMSEAAKNFQDDKPVGQYFGGNCGNDKTEIVPSTGKAMDDQERAVCLTPDDSSSASLRVGADGLDVIAENVDVGDLSSSRQADVRSGLKEAVSEKQVALWTAQLVRCLSSLHKSGVVCRDLRPDNLLLTQEGNVAVTYFGSWDLVDWHCHPSAQAGFYVAPELTGMPRASLAADWWSLGVIVFELLTGKTLSDCHPGGPDPYIPLNFPVKISTAARSFIEGLLQNNANERLGSGIGGVEDIMAHPFFVHIDWTTV